MIFGRMLAAWRICLGWRSLDELEGSNVAIAAASKEVYRTDASFQIKI